jgi:carbamoyltransferase
MKREDRGPTVIGIYLGHDQSSCLIRNGRIQFAIEEERLNRYKHSRPRALGGLWSQFSGKFGYFPWASLSYCLKAAGLELCDVDLIVIGDDQWAKDAKETINEFIPIRDKTKVLYIDEPKNAVHHFHHGLSSFFLSKFDEAAVLVIDGDGNVDENGYEAETGFVMNRTGKWRQVFKNRYAEKSPPRSGIGWMYEQISYLLGYGNHQVGLADPGKTMGLSAYGQSTKEFSEEWIHVEGFKLDFSGFKRWLTQTGYDQLIFGGKKGIATKFHEPSELARNLACKVQVEAERAILHLARTLRAKTHAAKLCLGGGVALNSVVNGKLLRENIFDDVYIMPAVHDGGQSVGLAIHGHLLLTHPDFNSGMKIPSNLSHAFDQQPIVPLESAYLGRTYDEPEIRKAFEECDLAFDILTDAELIESASTALAAGNIIGWFQGRAEIGPRALGNRSILASPTFPNMKDALNARVKFRESFRPFAPSVLAETCQDIFDISTDSPYMLLVADVRKEWIQRIPSVVHVDGTARLHTVTPSENPRFYSLIRSLGAKTGIPLVLNTSFNLNGMPIIEAPIDAIKCFIQTQLDELYLGNFRLRPIKPEALRYRIKVGWKISTSAAGEENGLSISAPNQTTAKVETSPRLKRAMAFVDGDRTVRDVMEKVGLSENEYDRLDAMMKKLVRMGCLEVKLGKHSVSNTRNDLTWDKTLYETV